MRKEFKADVRIQFNWRCDFQLMQKPHNTLVHRSFSSFFFCIYLFGAANQFTMWFLLILETLEECVGLSTKITLNPNCFITSFETLIIWHFQTKLRLEEQGNNMEDWKSFLLSLEIWWRATEDGERSWFLISLISWKRTTWFGVQFNN